MAEPRPSCFQSMSANEQAQFSVANCGSRDSTKGRSKPALCASTKSTPSSRRSTSASSSRWPRNMSSVMPVMAMISSGIGMPGSSRPSYTSTVPTGWPVRKSTVTRSRASSTTLSRAAFRPVVSVSSMSSVATGPLADGNSSRGASRRSTRKSGCASSNFAMASASVSASAVNVGSGWPAAWALTGACGIGCGAGGVLRGVGDLRKAIAGGMAGIVGTAASSKPKPSWWLPEKLFGFMQFSKVQTAQPNGWRRAASLALATPAKAAGSAGAADSAACQRSTALAWASTIKAWASSASKNPAC